MAEKASAAKKNTESAIDAVEEVQKGKEEEEKPPMKKTDTEAVAADDEVAEE